MTPPATPDEPRIPSNVRLELRDGTEVPAQPMFEGTFGGVRLWKATPRRMIDPAAVKQTLCDKIPDDIPGVILF